MLGGSGGSSGDYAPLTQKCRERKFPNGNYSVKSLHIHKTKPLSVLERGLLGGSGGSSGDYAPLTQKCRERKFPNGNYSVKSLRIHKTRPLSVLERGLLGGSGGIRTHERVTPLPDFESGPL